MSIKTYLVAPIPRWVALTAILSVGVTSSLTTFFVMDKRFNKLFEEKVNEEVENTTRFLSALKKTEYPTPESAAAALLDKIEDKLEDIEEVLDIVEENGYAPKEVVEVEVELVDIDFDFEAEAEIRASGKPYILEYHEFSEMDNPCICLQWFDGDGVLVDQDDTVVPDPNKIVGLKNLNRFGYGSKDENVIYIHNPYYDTNYEIVREPGNYVDQAYGHLQHQFEQFDQGGNRKRTLRKFHLNEE